MRARNNYSFVFDELIPEEEEKLKASLKVKTNRQLFMVDDFHSTGAVFVN